MNSKPLVASLLIALAGGCAAPEQTNSKLGFQLPKRARYNVTDTQVANATETLRSALTTNATGNHVKIAAPCVCGPGLWRFLKNSPHFAVPPTAKTTCKIPQPDGTTLEVPAALIQDEAEAVRFRSALSDLLSENGDLTFRLPTEREFNIFWATYPFDEIRDPLIVAEGSRYNLIVQFSKSRPFWIDEVKNTTLK